MPDLSFSSDALRMAAQYLDDSSPVTEVTPPAGDPCSRIYAQRISEPIQVINEEQKSIQKAMKKTRANMLETLHSFETAERGIADSIASVLKGDVSW